MCVGFEKLSEQRFCYNTGMESKTSQLIREFIRLKQASLAKQAEDSLSLDPRPSLEQPASQEKPLRKPARRVFPFKRYKLPELR